MVMDSAPGPCRPASRIRAGRWLCATALLAATMWGLLVIHRQQQAATLARDCARFLERHDWEQLQSAASQLVRQQRDEQGSGWFWLGKARQGQGNWPEAVTAYEHIGLDQPRGLEAAVARMEINLFKLHQAEAAVTLARAILQRSPRLGPPRNCLIYFYAMSGQTGPLLREIRLAIEYRTDIPDHFVYLMSADALAFRDAVEITGRWAEAAPESTLLKTAWLARQVQMSLADRARSVSVESQERRRSLMEQLRAVPPDNPQGQIILFMLELALAQENFDLDRVSQLLRTHPEGAVDDPRYWTIQGWELAQRRQLETARNALVKALEIFPLSTRARHALSDLHRLENRLEPARQAQSVASTGTALLAEMHRVAHVRGMPQSLLREMAEYARQCGDDVTFTALTRRLIAPVNAG